MKQDLTYIFHYIENSALHCASSMLHGVRYKAGSDAATQEPSVCPVRGSFFLILDLTSLHMWRLLLPRLQNISLSSSHGAFPVKTRSPNFKLCQSYFGICVRPKQRKKGTTSDHSQSPVTNAAKRERERERAKQSIKTTKVNNKASKPTMFCAQNLGVPSGFF